MGLHDLLQGELCYFRRNFTFFFFYVIRITPPSEPTMQLVQDNELITGPKIDPLLCLGLKGDPLFLFLGWNETTM
jgi:hypothetical protein